MKRIVCTILICCMLAGALCGCVQEATPTDPSQTEPTTIPPTTETTAPAPSLYVGTYNPPPPQEQTDYAKAEALVAEGKLAEAAIAFGKLAGYSDARERSFALWDQVLQRGTIAATQNHAFAIQSNGNVVYGGEEYLESEGPMIYQTVTEAGQWKNVLALDSTDFHIMGLFEDGTVSYLTSESTPCMDLSDWTDVVSIAVCGNHRAYGLRIDGSVISYPDNVYLRAQHDIVSICCDIDYFLALRTNGTVLFIGETTHRAAGVKEWTDITAIASFTTYALGLRSDGTVLCTNQEYAQITDTWTDVVAIFPGDRPIGLKSDGTVVVAEVTWINESLTEWTDIVYIDYTHPFYIGLRKDGSLVCGGEAYTNEDEILNYSDIMLP